MKTIQMLAKSRLKYNKSRSFLTAAAIMLTTVLLMGLGTSAVGMFDMNRQTASRESNVHATFKDLTYEQVEILKNHADVEAVTANEIFASVEYEKMNGFLTYDRDVKSGIYHEVGNLIEGRSAEKADEICGPEAFFSRMGVKPAIGNKITVSFRVGGEGIIETREFTICGLVSERDISGYNISDSRVAYGASVSDELINQLMPAQKRSCSAQIRVTGENNLNFDEVKAKIERVAADIGCDKDNINFNNEYLYTMTDPGSEAAGIVSGIALLIIIFSGIVIYSIYYVSVITDVQEIGKLKALGASKRQIKRLLLSEGMRISAIAIPLGLIIGYAIPYFFLPVVMNIAAKASVNASVIEDFHMFSLPVLIAVTVVVLLTVYISLLKPMRMAAKISPVEAIRYQESSKGGKVRKGYLNVNIFHLSLANLMRNKRRTAVTMITMGLSCVLFMSLAGVMNSVRADDIAKRNISKGDFRIQLDCSWNDKEYPENNFDVLQQQNIFSHEFVESIKNIDGVENVEREKAVLISTDFPSELFENGSRRDMSYLTRGQVDELTKELKRGEIDYDKMIAENGAVFTSDRFMNEYGFSIGDVLPLTVYDGNNRIEFDIKITASLDSGGESYFLIPQEVYDKLGMQFDSTTDLYISADKNKFEGVKSALQEISDSGSYFKLYSMDEELAIGSMSVNMVKYPLYVILVMVAVIGFMNLMNTMITSIVTRKRELGVLQAVGLSNKQLIKMLAGEGMVFTAGTLLASVTLGNFFGYLIFIWAKKTHMFSVSAYHYPIWETIGLAAVLILGQIFITYFINKRVHKESLIDRIRSGE